MGFDPKRAQEHADDMRRAQQELRAQGKGFRPGLLGTGTRGSFHDCMSPTMYADSGRAGR